MTSSQSFKMYEIFQRYFNNDADAKVIVEEPEQAIEIKFEAKKDTLATKEDIAELKLNIQELKTEILSSRVEMEKRFNTIPMWIIGTMIALVGIVVGILKLSS